MAFQQTAGGFGKLPLRARLLVYVVTLACFGYFSVGALWYLFSARGQVTSAISGAPTPVEELGLKIFVYSLPHRFNKDLFRSVYKNKKRKGGYQDQMAEGIIFQNLLNSPVRTLDPEEADLFYVPLFAAAAVSQLVHDPEKREGARRLVLEAHTYISTKFDYWKRYNGADHVWAFTHDHGPCTDVNYERAMESALTRELLHKLRDSIFLTNTGDLHSPCFNPLKSIVIPPYVGKPHFLELAAPRKPDSEHPVSEGRDIFASFRGQTTLIKDRDPWFRYIMLYGSAGDRVHNHGKQPTLEPCFDWAMNANMCASCMGKCCAAELADHRVYSNGVRQRLLAMYGGSRKKAGRKKILVSREKSKDWIEEMKRSVFCLCPAGFAKWSIRTFESIIAGCIPVIIATDLQMPFQNFVDWHSISVQVKESDVSKLEFILDDISPARVRAMQENLKSVQTMFSYLVTTETEGWAFTNIMNELAKLSALRKTQTKGPQKKAPWRNWRPIGAHKVRSVPYPPSHYPPVDEDNRDICLATQLSSDRADLLSRILLRWEGPVSAAVLMRQNAEGLDEQTLKEAFSDRISADPSRRLSFDFLYYDGDHPSKAYQHYPVNKLRNMALRGCNTKYYFVLDVDFLPSDDAYLHLQNHLPLLEGSGRNALVIPAFEVDADVLTTDVDAVDKVRHKETLRKLYMVDKRKRWRDTPRTASKARAFQLMHYKDGHHPTNTEKWMHTDQLYSVDYKWGYEPYLLLKRPFPLFEESFVGYGQNKVSYAYELAAARFSFIVIPNVYVIHVHTDKSIGVKVVSDTNKFKIDRKAIEILKKKKDFTVGWSCWRPFINRVDKMYGFRATEPCWVSEYVWRDVNLKHRECVVNV